jgi:hypothetical protein
MLLLEYRYAGNTHSPPSKAAVPTCTTYAGITASSVIGLSVYGNTMLVPSPNAAVVEAPLIQFGKQLVC